ncbi:MAG: flagellar hook-length control protein FliK [Lachnospiraceae bacterium]|nr:flagellar hook-length control protein FliK [Lachnospiraceae bacterium]
MTYTPVNGTRPMVMDFAPQVPDAGVATGDGSFTDVFKGQTQDNAKANAEAVKAPEKDNKGESLQNRKGPKEIKNPEEPKEANEVKPLDEEVKESIASEVEEVVTDAIAKIAEEFDMDPEEIIETIEKMGLAITDILIPENLTQVVLEVAGETEPMALVTDENLNNFVNDLNVEINEAIENLAAANNISKDEVIETAVETNTPAFAEVIEETAKEEDNPIKVTFEVKKDEKSEVKKEDRNESKAEVTKETYEAPKAPTTRSSEKKSSEQGHGEDKGNILLENIANKVTETVNEATGERITYTEVRQVMNQVIESIHVSVKPETSDIEMLLNPESLGTVNVHLSSKEGTVTAQFTTQNEQVKAILEDQMIELKETFEAKGVKVDNIEVQVQTNAFAQEYENSRERNNQDEERTNRRARRINLNALEEMSEELTEEEAISVSMMEANGSTVDYMA